MIENGIAENFRTIIWRKRKENSSALMTPFSLYPPIPLINGWKKKFNRSAHVNKTYKMNRTFGEMYNLFSYSISRAFDQKKWEKWSQWHFLPAASYSCIATGMKSIYLYTHICTSKLKHGWAITTTANTTTETSLFVRHRHHFYK